MNAKKFFAQRSRKGRKLTLTATSLQAVCHQENAIGVRFPVRFAAHFRRIDLSGKRLFRPRWLAGEIIRTPRLR